MKKYRGFYLKFFEFLEVKSSIYLNRHVFVMAPADLNLRWTHMPEGIFRTFWLKYLRITEY